NDGSPRRREPRLLSDAGPGRFHAEGAAAPRGRRVRERRRIAGDGAGGSARPLRARVRAVPAVRHRLHHRRPRPEQPVDHLGKHAGLRRRDPQPPRLDPHPQIRPGERDLGIGCRPVPQPLQRLAPGGHRRDRPARLLNADELRALPAPGDRPVQRRALNRLAPEAHHERPGDVGMRAETGEHLLGEVRVPAQLGAAVLVLDRHRARSALGRRPRRLGRADHRWDDEEMAADAQGAVRALPPSEGRGSLSHPYRARSLRTLWTWTCWPGRISAVATPITSPYLITGAPAAMAATAILCPNGIKVSATTRTVSPPRRTSTAVPGWSGASAMAAVSRASSRRTAGRAADTAPLPADRVAVPPGIGGAGEPARLRIREDPLHPAHPHGPRPQQVDLVAAAGEGAPRRLGDPRLHPHHPRGQRLADGAYPPEPGRRDRV